MILYLHNSLLDNIMNHSNNEYQNKNNYLNKNIKILNKSNNNASCSNSNSNSVYNKKKIVDVEGLSRNNKEDNNISPLKQFISVTQKESSNIFKKINKNPKSQIFVINDNNNKNTNNNNIKDEENDEKRIKLKTPEEKRKNNFTSHSTINVKKPKNTSPIIFSTKHNNKNKIKMDMNLNSQNKYKDKSSNDNSLNENNIRRANSFIIIKY